MEDYYFDPEILRGSPGQQITVELHNLSKSGAIHDFRINGQGIDVDVPAGQQASVKVMFPQSGSTEFDCKYHVAQNMRGRLELK